MTVKGSILSGLNGSNSTPIVYGKPENLRASSWAVWPTNPAPTFIAQEDSAQSDEGETFTRQDFLMALEASAVELGENLKNLESRVPEKEMDEWLAAFNKSE